jgi:hypothetical protein
VFRVDEERRLPEEFLVMLGEPRRGVRSAVVMAGRADEDDRPPALRLRDFRKVFGDAERYTDVWRREPGIGLLKRRTALPRRSRPRRSASLPRPA